MNFNNYTIKAQEAVQQAQEIAAGMQHQAINNIHLLKGILVADENVIPFLLKKLNVNVGALSADLDRRLQVLPKVTGGESYFSPEVSRTLQKAASFLKEFGDEFVSIEHLLLGILASDSEVSGFICSNTSVGAFNSNRGKRNWFTLRVSNCS